LLLEGQYFARTEMFKQQSSFELFRSQKEKDELLEKISAVERALSAFPPPYTCNGEDIQVFELQQRSIGELIIAAGAGDKTSVLSFVTFQDSVSSKRFQQHLAPLRALLDGVSPESECRWKRLEATRSALGELQTSCRRLLWVEQPSSPNAR
jgi:hypothetical protein